MLLFGWLVRWFVGWLVGWLDGWMVGWLVGWFGWFVWMIGGRFALERKSILQYCSPGWQTHHLFFLLSKDVARLKSYQRGNVCNGVIMQPCLGQDCGMLCLSKHQQCAQGNMSIVRSSGLPPIPIPYVRSRRKEFLMQPLDLVFKM